MPALPAEPHASPHVKPRALLWKLGLAGAVLGWMLLWLCVGVLQQRLGPHRFDDFRYAYDAIAGHFDNGIRFRYVHVWGLRAFYLLLDDRVTAAAAYAATVHAGIVGATVLLARQAAGRRAGVLTGIFAALLMPFYPPLLMFASTPLPDPPSTLYAALALAAAMPWRDKSHHALWALLAGLLCFASVKCKESGIAVLPAVAFLLYQQQGQRRRMLGYWLMGAAGGQVMLCIADGLITGDPWHSLRLSVFKTYTAAIGGTPSVPRKRRMLMRNEWLALLLKPGTREFVLLGMLGIAHAARRNLAVLACTAWATCTLLFGAWVSWRYAGIDAHVRYLGPLGPPLVVAGAVGLAGLWHAHGSSAVTGGSTGEPAGGSTGESAGDSTGESTGDPHTEDEQPRQLGAGLLWALCAAGITWVAWFGIDAGIEHLRPGKPSFDEKRAHFFLLPLTAPLCLLLASAAPWTAPWRWLRRLSLLPVLLAVGLLAWPPAYGYVKKARKSTRPWQRLGAYLDRSGSDEVIRYRTGNGGINAGLLRWRLVSLSSLEPSALTLRDATTLADVDDSALLLIDAEQKQACDEVKAAGWKPVMTVPRGRRRLRIYRHDAAD